jgi:hypothetical protein
MNDFIASYSELFEPAEDRPLINRIEIPLIQRDYAQGRTDQKATRIRSEFLGTLYGAVAGGEPIGLDFVYGDLESGTFRPLDGQQRLTALFLLHWYLAYRGGRIAGTPSWGHFSYATREGARVFCERLVEFPPPPEQEDPAGWVRDQSWYRYLWQHDPTIQSMLVMISAIDEQFRQLEPDEAWTRLTDPEHRAISVHVLTVEEMGTGEELYIKMNSRGKPLTDFETFKARFERWIEGSAKAEDFQKKVDGVWADLLWPFDTGDNTVDDEFMRYFEYLTQICEWRNDVEAEGPIDVRAQRAFAIGSPHAEENLEFLFGAFDAWEGSDVSAFFASNFTKMREEGRLHLFTSDDVNLFRLCCHSYGVSQRFGNAEAFLLYAVLLHRIYETEDFPRRMRVVRNLVTSSTNEIRPENMTKLVREIEMVVRDGDLHSLVTFNSSQIEDEQLKQDFLAKHQSLLDAVYRLEDHEILRGSLMAIDFDTERFTDRAAAFEEVFSDPKARRLLTGALLTMGNYSRPNRPNYPDRRRFGSPSIEGPWRLVLTGASRVDLSVTRSCLSSLLDEVAGWPGQDAKTLAGIRDTWIKQQDAFDWRYYLVRYEWMREGTSGLYTCPGAVMGFSIRMLDKTVLSSNHREPFVYAAWRESGIGDSATDPLFFGYMPEGCWLALPGSGIKLRNVDEGWEVQRLNGDPNEELGTALAEHGVDGEGLLRIAQVNVDNRAYDSVDRIQVASALLQDIVKICP